jgi:hypothetical protein
MRYHHTKNKGDLGAIKAMADMAEKGWSVFAGLSEHQAFDFAAYKDGRFLRVQVKYRTLVRGTLLLDLKATWSDRNGIHKVPIDRSAFDLLCIYCPDTDRCYYVSADELDAFLSLRVNPCRNNQSKRIRWAQNYLEIPSSVRGVSAGETSGLVGWGWVRQSAEPRAA